MLCTQPHAHSVCRCGLAVLWSCTAPVARSTAQGQLCCRPLLEAVEACTHLQRWVAQWSHTAQQLHSVYEEGPVRARQSVPYNVIFNGYQGPAEEIPANDPLVAVPAVGTTVPYGVHVTLAGARPPHSPTNSYSLHQCQAQCIIRPLTSASHMSLLVDIRFTSTSHM